MDVVKMDCSSCQGKGKDSEGRYCFYCEGKGWSYILKEEDEHN